GFAGDAGWHPDLGLLAGEGFGEGDFHVVAQVGTALARVALAGAAAAAPAAHEFAEQVVEDVGHRGREVGAEAAGPAGAAPAVLEGGVAELVVGGPLLLVLEDLVGLVDLFEFLLGGGVTRIAVRMVLLGEAAESAFQIAFTGASFDAENIVVVALGHENVIR